MTRGPRFPRLPRFLESNSIQITIAASFAAVVLFTVLFLGASALVLTRDSLWETTTYYTEQLVEQVRAGIDDYLGEMDGIATAVLEDEVLGDPSLGADRRAGGPAVRPEEIRRVMGTVSRMRSDITLLALARPDLGVLLHDASLKLNPAVDPFSQDWYRSASAAGGAAVYSGARVQNLVQDRYRWVVSLSRARGELVLLVDLNFSVIEQLARSVELGPRGYLFLMDADGRIIYHPQQQLIYSDLTSEPIAALRAADSTQMVLTRAGEERLYIVDTVDRTGWRIVAVTAVDQLLAPQRQLRSYYLWWVALCLAIVMVLTVVISRRISLPVMRLRGSMRAVEQGRFDIEPTVKRRDEIGALSRDFALMVATVRDLMARNAREQEEKRRSEVKALQHQITPHFLYNTLDSIVWMAEGGRMDEVIDMTTNLAQLLRLSIGREESMVTLQTELDHVRSYLTIQEMRYRDRLRFDLDAAPETLSVELPSLTLQPVVENAIYHGVKSRPHGGAVRVAARHEGTVVVISVEDDGPGIAPDVLDRLRRHEVEPTGGVGLKNVHRRLALTFGEEYGVRLYSTAGEGTRVDVLIPAGPVR